MKMPLQKPGQSKQDYQTPKELLLAVYRRFGIKQFALDIAADSKNTIAPIFYDESADALAPHNRWYWHTGTWAWCNPPYANIEPWVAKAKDEAMLHAAHMCMLVPSSVGSEWWKNHVDNFAYVLHLNGRLTFIGCDTPYPKDCSLLIYVPWRATGSQVWDWRKASG